MPFSSDAICLRCSYTLNGRRNPKFLIMASNFKSLKWRIIIIRCNMERFESISQRKKLDSSVKKHNGNLPNSFNIEKADVLLEELHKRKDFAYVFHFFLVMRYCSKRYKHKSALFRVSKSIVYISFVHVRSFCASSRLIVREKSAIVTEWLSSCCKNVVRRLTRCHGP